MGKFKKGHEPWNKGKRNMKKEPVDWRIVCTAILALVGLEIGAMFHGINGKFFALVMAAISGLAGLNMPQIKFK